MSIYLLPYLVLCFWLKSSAMLACGLTSLLYFSCYVPPAFGVGQGFAAGAALLGIGGLCYYGLGLSAEAGAVDKAA